MKEWGIEIASKKGLRNRAFELVNNNLKSELALFSFPLKTGGEELVITDCICTTPIAKDEHMRYYIIVLYCYKHIIA